MKPLPKTLTLAVSAAGAIGLAPALGAANIGSALATFGAAFFAALFSRDSINSLDALFAQFDRDAASGKLPPNHDIEHAAQEACRATLLILAEHLEKSGRLNSYSAKKWLKALCAGLQKANPKAVPPLEPPAPWPDFSLVSDAPADVLAQLWRQKDGVFAGELREKTKAWFRVFEIETQTITPGAALDAIERGWEIPGSGGARHTLSSVWAECFRFQIKHTPPAAAAHLFGTLARLIEGQREILGRLPAAGTPAGAQTGAQTLATLQAQFAAISQKLESSDQRVLDELAALKQRIPAPEDLKYFNERLAGLAARLDIIADRLDETTDRLGETTKKWDALLRKWGWKLALAASVIALAFGAVLWRGDYKQKRRDEEMKRWQSQQEAEQARRHAELMAKLEAGEKVADKFIADSASPASLPGERKLSGDERVDNTLGSLPDEQKELLEFFQRTIRSMPDATLPQRSKLAVSEKRFGEAVALAGESVNLVETHLADLEKIPSIGKSLAKTTQDKKRELLDMLFESRKLQGQALVLAEKFGDAVAACLKAQEKITRENMPGQWAELQFLLGNAASDWANRSESAAVNQRRQQAITAYRAALEVYTREAFPKNWAMTQNNLGLALSDQVSASEGKTQARLLAEAVVAYRDALKVYTREAFPQGWAMTQNNLGNALRNQAMPSEGEKQARLLAEAVAAYRAALEVRTREAFPQDWAATQNNLGAALHNQAMASEGETQARLLAEAVAAYRAALEVYTREAFPKDWAGTQNNLGIALGDQAMASEGETQTRLLAEAVAAYRAALEVYTREAFPQGWATTQNNLGTALGNQAMASEGADRTRLLEEAIGCFDAVLEVHTKEHFPEQHQRTQNNLSLVRRLLAWAKAGNPKNQ